jgi:hypothetical protein
MGHVGHQTNQQQDHPQDNLIPRHAALTVVRMLFASIDLRSFRELAEDPVDSLLLVRHRLKQEIALPVLSGWIVASGLLRNGLHGHSVPESCRARHQDSALVMA